MLGSATCPFVLWAPSRLGKKPFVSSNKHIGQLQGGKKNTFALGIGSRSFQISRSNLRCDSNPSRGGEGHSTAPWPASAHRGLQSSFGGGLAATEVSVRHSSRAEQYPVIPLLAVPRVNYKRKDFCVWAGIHSCWEWQPALPVVWPSPERCFSGSCLQPWSVSHTVLVKQWRHSAQLCGLDCN